jgi:GcrA cell cycle regulator
MIPGERGGIRGELTMQQDLQPAQIQTWTTERVELLKQMWADGLSASNIAGRLGAGISRNAVIGKVHRLGLSGRASPALAANPRPRRPRQPSHPGSLPGHSAHAGRSRAFPTAGATALKPQVCQERVVEPDPEPIRLVDVPKGERVNILMLSEKTCRWPIGEPGTEDFFFCGMSPREQTPYCEYHARIAYQPLHDRRRMKRG